jgi:hypothetical protein
VVFLSLLSLALSLSVSKRACVPVRALSHTTYHTCTHTQSWSTAFANEGFILLARGFKDAAHTDGCGHIACCGWVPCYGDCPDSDVA